MPKTLSDFRTSVLATLDDASNTYYTNTQIDEAIRQALEEYSRLRILPVTYAATSDGEYRQALPADFDAAAITDVQYPAYADPSNANRIPFYATHTDEQWILEFGDVIPPADAIFYVYYYKLHTIDGLDSAAGTTVEARDYQAFVMGAAGFAQLARASSRTESPNINPDTAKHLRESGNAKIAVMRSLSKSATFITAKWLWGAL